MGLIVLLQLLEPDVKLIGIGNSSRIKCNDCSIQYDSDYNACIKISKKGIFYKGLVAKIRYAWAADGLAKLRMISPQKSMDLEATSLN